MKNQSTIPASRIIITTTEDGQLDIALSGIKDFPQFTQQLFTGLLAMMTNTWTKAKAISPEAAELAQQEIYDMINNAASNTLSMFAPEIDMRPTVTTEALLRMENQVMQEAIDAHEQRNGPMPVIPFAPKTLQ